MAQGHVFDVDVVAGLLSGPVDLRLAARRQIAAEDGHDPGLSVRVLARTIDVGVAQRRVGETVLRPVEVQVALASELRDAIGRDRVLGVILGGRELALLAVDRASGRGEDDLFYVVLDAVFEQPQRSQHVDVGVEVRLPDRAPHVHLGRLVAERLRAELLEDPGAPGADVQLVEQGVFGKFSLLPVERSSTTATS